MLETTLEQELEEAITLEREKLLQFARRLVPSLTPEDILQPNDFNELEQHPAFRYEEGYLHGLLAARALLLRVIKESF